MNTRLVKRCELQVFDFRHLLEWNTRVVGLLELILLQNFCLAEGITVQWRADRLRVPIFSAGRQAGRFKIQFSSFRKFRTGRAIFCENWILNRPACCLPKKSGPSTYQLLTAFLPDAGIAFLPHIECEGGRELYQDGKTKLEPPAYPEDSSLLKTTLLTRDARTLLHTTATVDWHRNLVLQIPER